jgi:hypothetical protein
MLTCKIVFLVKSAIRVIDNAERRMTAGQTAISQVGEVVSRYSHKVKDGGSNPSPATKYKDIWIKKSN